MEITLQQSEQFKKNPEINPITGKKIQIGKKTHQLLTLASSKYSSNLSDNTIYAVVEINFESNPIHSYQHYVGLFNNLDTAFDAMMVQIVDNLLYQKKNLNDESVVKHLIYQYQINSNFVPLQKWCLNLEDNEKSFPEIEKIIHDSSRVRNRLSLF